MVREPKKYLLNFELLETSQTVCLINIYIYKGNIIGKNWKKCKSKLIHKKYIENTVTSEN